MKKRDREKKELEKMENLRMFFGVQNFIIVNEVAQRSCASLGS